MGISGKLSYSASGRLRVARPGYEAFWCRWEAEPRTRDFADVWIYAERQLGGARTVVRLMFLADTSQRVR